MEQIPLTAALRLSQGNLTLGGANVYSGATNVNAGALTLNSGASLGNTAITVASGTSLVANPGSGNIQIGSTGASLTLNTGAALTLNDGAVGKVTLNSTGAGSRHCANIEWNVRHARLSHSGC